MKILDLIFPPRCFGCDEYLVDEEVLVGACDACRHTVHAVASPRCPRCSLPREIPVGVDELCTSCLKQPPAFAAAFACWIYDGAVRDAIRSSKSRDDAAPLAALGRSSTTWFADVASRYADSCWTTVPAHPRDLRRRGWDPPRALLEVLCRETKIVLMRKDLLAKTCVTPKQARLDRAARRIAPADAFEAVGPVKGTVVLFDDVMTTGATLHHAARALRRAGARRVIAVALARAV